MGRNLFEEIDQWTPVGKVAAAVIIGWSIAILVWSLIADRPVGDDDIT